jgi:hypothetical protein
LYDISTAFKLQTFFFGNTKATSIVIIMSANSKCSATDPAGQHRRIRSRRSRSSTHTTNLPGIPETGIPENGDLGRHFFGESAESAGIDYT